MPAETVIKLRGGTAAEWTSANPVLAAREIGIETDTNKSKYGDGSTAWTSLPYSVASASGSSTVEWTDVLNKPTEFPPEDHTHLLADITDYVVPDTLPDQTGNTGKYLTTDGTDPSWAALDIPPGTVISETAPSTPDSGQLWWNSTTGTLYIYYDATWVEAVTGVTGPAGADGSDGALSPNYIINGAFDVWQRGTDSGSVTSNQYEADRWFFNRSGATAQVTKQPMTLGDINAIGFGAATSFLRVSVTVGNNFTGLKQRVEGVETLSGQTVTLSFWAKGTNPNAGSFDVNLVQNFGSGGSSSVATLTQTFTATASWQRYSYIFEIPSITGKTIGSNSFLDVTLPVQKGSDTSTDAWELDIWGVQLEAGSVATPFKRNANSLHGELAACQRYYYRMQAETTFQNFASGSYYTTSSHYSTIPFPVAMRVAPTASFSTFEDFRVYGSGTTKTATAISQARSSTYNSQIICTTAVTTAAGVGGWLAADGNTDAYIEWSAEL